MCGGEKRRGGTRNRERQGQRERRGERKERTTPSSSRVDSNAGDISTNQITPRAPPFIIILLVFPLLHPHWMTFSGPFRGAKKLPAPNRGLHASSDVLRYPSGTHLGSRTTSTGIPLPEEMARVLLLPGKSFSTDFHCADFDLFVASLYETRLIASPA